MSTSITAAAERVTVPKVAPKATYSPTDAAITDGAVTLQGCRRDSDDAPFVAVTRKTSAAGPSKVRYMRADYVLRYAHLLAVAAEPITVDSSAEEVPAEVPEIAAKK